MIIDTDSQLRGDRRPGVSGGMKRSARGGGLRSRIKRGLQKLRWWRRGGDDLHDDDEPPSEISELEDGSTGAVHDAGR